MPPEAPYLWTDAVQLVEQPRPSLDNRPPKPPAAAGRRSHAELVKFLLIVVFPTLLALLYFGFIAADRYVSEARLLVRNANSLGRAASPGFSVEEGPKNGGGNDSFAVREYILSRDAMDLLRDHAGLRQAVAGAGYDLWWRFPSVLTGYSDEALYRLYGSLVSVDYQNTTGLIELRVQALAPDDARRMAAVLIDGAEALVNRLNDRSRTDAVRVAEQEVTSNRAKASEAQERLTQFRQREAVIDPTLLSQTIHSTIAALSLQAVEASAQLDMTLQTSPNSPQILPLRSRIQAVQGQIDRERKKLAGGQGSFAPKIAEYERLLLDRDFAQKSFVSSLHLLETSRLDAQRQQSYLERVAEPHAADEAFYPHRIFSILGIFLAGLAIFWAFRSKPGPTGQNR